MRHSPLLFLLLAACVAGEPEPVSEIESQAVTCDATTFKAVCNANNKLTTCEHGTPITRKCADDQICNPVTATCGYCGNGVRDPGEECDDANTNDFDDCRADCMLPTPACDPASFVARCDGNTLVQCEHGFEKATACGDDRTCNPLAESCGYCGDSVRDAAEECDDANLSDLDDCLGDCTLPCPANETSEMWVDPAAAATLSPLAKPTGVREPARCAFPTLAAGLAAATEATAPAGERVHVVVSGAPTSLTVDNPLVIPSGVVVTTREDPDVGGAALTTTSFALVTDGLDPEPTVELAGGEVRGFDIQASSNQSYVVRCSEGAGAMSTVSVRNGTGVGVFADGTCSIDLTSVTVTGFNTPSQTASGVVIMDGASARLDSVDSAWNSWGIRLFGSGSVQLTSSSASFNTRAGLLAMGTGNTVVTNGTFLGNGSAGIYAIGATTTVSGSACDIGYNGDEGVRIEGGYAFYSVAGCHIHDNGAEGVASEGYGVLQIDGATIEHNAGSGVSVTSTAAVVVHSRVAHNGFTGPSCSDVQLVPQLVFNGPAGDSGSFCSSYIHPVLCQMQPSCGWGPSGCVPAYVVGNPFTATCGAGWGSSVVDYDVNDGASAQSVGVAAFNGATVMANGNTWASENVTENVWVDALSSVNAGLICGTEVTCTP
jgi:cysteine-rich repeat protein